MKSLSSEQIVRFGLNQSGNECLGSGWGSPEDGFVWSEGKFARIELEGTANVTALQLTVWGYVPPDAGPQEVVVFLNGLLTGYFEISQRVTCDLVPRRPLTASTTVEFLVSTARRPADHEGVDDRRQLGIALASISLVR